MNSSGTSTVGIKKAAPREPGGRPTPKRPMVKRIEQVRRAAEVEQPDCSGPPGGPEHGQCQQRKDIGDHVAVGRRTGEGCRQLWRDNPWYKECKTNEAERVECEKGTEGVLLRKDPELRPDVASRNHAPCREAEYDTDAKQG